jgi:hypothetical protein
MKKYMERYKNLDQPFTRDNGGLVYVLVLVRHVFSVNNPLRPRKKKLPFHASFCRGTKPRKPT